MYRYLKDKQYYEDAYDLHTIEECLKWYWDLKDGMEKHRDELKQKEPDVDFDKEVSKVCSYTVNVLKVNRFRSRRSSIDEWMNKDQRLQEVFDNASAPYTRCDKCQSSMKVIDKNLHYGFNDEPKVSFIYECDHCKFRKILYSDGSPWDYKAPTCPKCNSTLKHKAVTKGEILTETTSCSKCGYKNTEVTDFNKDHLEREKEEQRRTNLLKQYREQFCLDDTKGPEAVTGLDNICRLVESWKDKEKKEKDPIFQKAKQLKTLKLNQLKEIVSKAIAEKDCVDLQFSQPELGKYVIVEFTATDNIDNRSVYDSTHILKKTIKETLEETNWRLMSEGIHYRLGIVSGRLKAYETEEDLMELVKT